MLTYNLCYIGACLSCRYIKCLRYILRFFYNYLFAFVLTNYYSVNIKLCKKNKLFHTNIHILSFNYSR